MVIPVWGDGLSIGISRADGYRAMREALEGSLLFVREDYDLIKAADFEQKFWLKIEVDDGAGYYERLRGYFFKTYLTEDEDKKQFTLSKIVTTDRYERIMNGINREFNVPDICPANPVKFVLQPVVQVYVPGNNYITNINGGNHWEQPVNSPESSSSVLINTYFFKEGQDVYYIQGRGELTPDVGGQYFYDSGLNEYSNGHYDIRTDGTKWQIFDILNSDLLVYEGTPGQTDVFATTFTSETDSGTCVLIGQQHFVRILCNVDTLDGNTTEDIPANDIVTQDNYTKVLGLEYNQIFASDEHSPTPTGFAKIDSGALYFADEYFDYPINNPVIEYYFPVNQSEWSTVSFWMYFNTTLRDYQEDAATERTVKDAYLFGDVLAAVLAEIDSEVTHELTSTYSSFLYSDSNPLRSESVPFLVPKTNITIGDYDLAASKAIVTLKDLLELARIVWNCFWHIESDGKFIVEHVDYYRRGKTYTGANILFDLSLEREPKNDLLWSHGARVYSYDLAGMPERIEKNWQEQGSEVFDGLPSEVSSTYVNPGTVEKKPLSRFFSDLDFALSGEVNKDGFFYLETDTVENKVIFETVTFRGKTYKLQNGRASIVYNNTQYGLYDLPAENVTVNGTATTAVSVKRSKVTNVPFAGVETAAHDYNELIGTEKGFGEIESAKVQLSTGIISIESLKIDTGDN